MLVPLEPVPEERLVAWLKEFYGKPVKIQARELLRHRDFSYVERLYFKDALPESLIYKLVLPPWDIEQDLHQRILIPSIASSAQLFMTAHYGQITAMLLEDLGSNYLKDTADRQSARRLGEEIARMHRSYAYRTDELIALNILRSITPIDFDGFAGQISETLLEWQDITSKQAALLSRCAMNAAKALAGEPITLVHGDLYAENIVIQGDRHYIIDWSWFTTLGVPLVDLASITSNHEKNGALRNYSRDVLEAYCFEYERKVEDIDIALPHGLILERILFLDWLVERKKRGVLGTTVGPVESLIQRVLDSIEKMSSS